MHILHRRVLSTASNIQSVPEQDPRTQLDWLYGYQLAKYVQWELTSGILLITIDFPVEKLVSAVGIAGHDFSVDTTVSVNGDTAVPLEEIHGIVECTPTLAAQHTIEIYDPLAIGGVNRIIGRLELGNLYRPPAINDQLNVSEVSNSSLVLSASRQAYGYRKTTYTRATVQFPVVEAPEMRALMEFYQSVDVFIPFFLGFEEECVTAKTNYAILEESNTLPLNYQYSQESVENDHYWTSTLTFSEVF